MTIQRQYQLPNCTLVLEGLTDSQSYTQPSLDVMSILIDAQCHFHTQEQQVGGGMEFLQGLVAAVSRYAQEFLSQTRSLAGLGGTIPAVQLQPVEGNRHCLLVYPESSSMEGESSDRQVQQIYLSTLELFDLLEAIDQLLADRLTLPHLSLQLQPLPKQYVQRSSDPNQQVLPAAVGIAGVAIAGAVFFWMPYPEVKRPQQLLPDSQDQNPTSTSPATTPTSQPSPQNSATNPEPTLEGEPTVEPTPEAPASETATPTPPSVEELQAALSIRPEITDPNQLEALKWQLYNELEKAWDNREYVEDLEYQVGVGSDGAILGYKHLNAPAEQQTESTPLPDLVYLPTSEEAAAPESVALFRVVFTENGNLEVSPWRGYISEPDPPPEIQDAATILDLQDRLIEKVTEALPEDPTFDEPLEYRVEMSQSGAMIDYEAQTQSARQQVSRTPLAGLLEPAQRLARDENGAVRRARVAEFRLVFQPGGTLEVSPWHGFP